MIIIITIIMIINYHILLKVMRKFIILNSLNPDLQPKNAEFAIKNKLKSLLVNWEGLIML